MGKDNKVAVDTVKCFVFIHITHMEQKFKRYKNIKLTS